MLRTILVASDGSPFSATATTLALDWGARFGARLIGLGILDEPSITGGEAVSIGGGAYKEKLDQARLAAAHGRISRFLSTFRDRCSAASVSAETCEDVGDPTQCILRQALRCDVVVLGYETNFHLETQESPNTVHAKILRRCSRPIVVVPRELPEGSGVVVAWGGGSEVARTLQTFLLLGLAGEETMHLVGVFRKGDQVDSSAGFAAEFLRSHGARYEVHLVPSTAAPAEVLLNQIRARQPRLVVMGAHVYHSLQDLFATSVTRAVLLDCPVPVMVGS